MSTNTRIAANEPNRTRHTLIERLKNREDHKAWDEFAGIYKKLIFGVAMKCGLRDVEEEDVVQETLISVSKNIEKFRADPAFGSFRAWLLALTRWRVIDELRKRNRPGQNAGIGPPQRDECQ